MQPKPQTILLTIHRGLYELGSYAKLGLQRGSSGMAPVNLHDHGNGMLGVWAMLAGEWAVMMMLAWYLEQVRACQHPDAVSTALDCSECLQKLGMPCNVVPVSLFDAPQCCRSSNLCSILLHEPTELLS